MEHPKGEIERARPRSDAVYAVIQAVEDYTTGISISRMWQGEEIFLAYQMNSEPLPPVHNYLVRIFLPGKFGMKRPKWITCIKLVFEKYWDYREEEGLSNEADRWVRACFTELKNGAEFADGKLELFDNALGPLAGIRVVEISLDKGRIWEAT